MVGLREERLHLVENLGAIVYSLMKTSYWKWKKILEKMNCCKINEKWDLKKQLQSIVVMSSEYFAYWKSQSLLSNAEINLFIKCHITVQGWSYDKSLRVNNLSFSLKQAIQFSFEQCHQFERT